MKKKKVLRQAGVFVLMICTVLFYTMDIEARASQWVVVDTGQDKCYNDNGGQVACPGEGSAFHGQDAQYDGAQPDFTDNGDGTVTDNNTGLMWQKTPGSKVTWSVASANASSFSLAGYGDWRLPTIKELYSLIDFRGVTGTSAGSSTPYIDTVYFDFNYGDTSAGERFIDAQYCSSTQYVGTTMGGNATIFGVNFADGRIKGYPKQNKTYYVMYVRGGTGYGTNNFVDNGDGTVTDQSTGLMWMRDDSGILNGGARGDGALNWEEALDWAESLEYAGHTDWRLPNAKELQGVVDYTRSPDITGTPAIDPIFNTTSILDGNGQVNYPYFWTGTTHLGGTNTLGSQAIYIAFGEAQGYMQDPWGNYDLQDVHGAGAQRSDPKSGNPDQYPYGRGPQGDVVYIYNYVRCVRDAGDNTGETEHTLTVQSSSGSGAAIAVSPVDNSGNGDGVTTFTRVYTYGTEVTLTAPVSYGGGAFSRWTVDGTNYSSRSVQVTMNSDLTAVVYYSSSGTSNIVLDRSRLNYGAVRGGATTPAQSLFIGSSGEGVLDWTVGTDVSWLTVSPAGGTGGGTVTVSASAGGLAVGTYTGTITVSAANASNSPQTVDVYFNVYGSGDGSFGLFATPGNGSVVSSSVPFTGWVLDSVGVSAVKLYRENGGSLVYIGDAVFVEGARPDVEAGYPQYPFNYRAGWGYMMLTHFLPNGGNGTFTIHAVAVNLEGKETTLGTRTIAVDNASAVKPFGAIDTPVPGGTASGGTYRNVGWVLTPVPNTIPVDGSTIVVYVDGRAIGSPVYNRYRSDIASLFPGYSNSGGAMAYLDIDTTAYTDGIHTISWAATDNAGNTDGIGSRYFSIRNAGVSGRARRASMPPLPDMSRIPGTRGVMVVNKGFQPDRDPEIVEPGRNGVFPVRLHELERLEIKLDSGGSQPVGYIIAGNRLKPLPIGSTLDSENGVFYWQPGPGFYGTYSFVFLDTDTAGHPRRTLLDIHIH